MTPLYKFGYPVLDLLFPCTCAGCGSNVPYSFNGVCAACRNSITRITDACPVCSNRMIGKVCVACRERTVYMSATISLAEYTGAMKRIIASLKFGNHKRAAWYLSELASERLDFLEPFDCITAVPMSSKKKWKRGYNQSELVARGISGMLRVPYRRLLSEKNRAASQKTLSVTERFINTIDRYRVCAGGVEGLRVLIVDDVYTTGSTINECSRLLLESGCARVDALVLARVPMEHNVSGLRYEIPDKKPAENLR